MESIVNFFDMLLQYNDFGLFAMRLYLGLLFAYSGQKKLRGLQGFARHNGLPVWLALIVVLFELVGGIGVLLGVYTQVAALMIMGIMVGSIFFHTVKWKSKFWAQDKGWEYDLMLLLMALVVLLSGGGSLGTSCFPLAW